METDDSQRQRMEKFLKKKNLLDNKRNNYGEELFSNINRPNLNNENSIHDSSTSKMENPHQMSKVKQDDKSLKKEKDYKSIYENIRLYEEKLEKLYFLKTFSFLFASIMIVMNIRKEYINSYLVILIFGYIYFYHAYKKCIQININQVKSVVNQEKSNLVFDIYHIVLYIGEWYNKIYPILALILDYIQMIFISSTIIAIFNINN